MSIRLGFRRCLIPVGTQSIWLRAVTKPLFIAAIQNLRRFRTGFGGLLLFLIDCVFELAFDLLDFRFEFGNFGRGSVDKRFLRYILFTWSINAFIGPVM